MTKEERAKRVSDESIKNYFDREEWETQNHIDIDECADVNADPAQILCEREACKIRQSEFKKLLLGATEKERVILTLYYIHGLKIADIADMYQTNSESIISTINQAKEHIRYRMNLYVKLIEFQNKDGDYDAYDYEFLNALKTLCQTEKVD